MNLPQIITPLPSWGHSSSGLQELPPQGCCPWSECTFVPDMVTRCISAGCPPGCGAAGSGRLRPSLSGQGHMAFHGVCARSPSHQLAQPDCPPLPTTGVFQCFPCSSSGRRVGRGPALNCHFPDEHLSHVCQAPGAPALRRGAVSCLHVRFRLAVFLVPARSSFTSRSRAACQIHVMKTHFLPAAGLVHALSVVYFEELKL